MTMQLWTIHEVAEYLNVHENTVRKLMKNGGLPHFRLELSGGQLATAIRFDKEDLMQWLQNFKHNSNGR